MRLVPLVLVAGGLAGLARTAPQTTERVLQTVRSVLVQHEVATIARAIGHAKTLGAATPQPGQPSQLAAFIRETMSAKGRDPALDLWETPYRLELQGQGLVVVSCGPNRVRDACPSGVAPGDTSLDSAPDDVCETVPP